MANTNWYKGMPPTNPSGLGPKGERAERRRARVRLAQTMRAMVPEDQIAQFLYAVAFQGAFPPAMVNPAGVEWPSVVDIGGRSGVSDEIRMLAFKMWLERSEGMPVTREKLDEQEEYEALAGGDDAAARVEALPEDAVLEIDRVLARLLPGGV